MCTIAQLHTGKIRKRIKLAHPNTFFTFSCPKNAIFEINFFWLPLFWYLCLTTSQSKCTANFFKLYPAASLVNDAKEIHLWRAKTSQQQFSIFLCQVGPPEPTVQYIVNYMRKIEPPYSTGSRSIHAALRPLHPCLICRRAICIPGGSVGIRSDGSNETQDLWLIGDWEGRLSWENFVTLFLK